MEARKAAFTMSLSHALIADAVAQCIDMGIPVSEWAADIYDKETGRKHQWVTPDGLSGKVLRSPGTRRRVKW